MSATMPKPTLTALLDNLRQTKPMEYDMVVLGDEYETRVHLGVSEDQAVEAIAIARCVEGIPCPRTLGKHINLLLNEREVFTDDDYVEAWRRALADIQVPGFSFGDLTLDHILNHRLEVCQFVVGVANAYDGEE